MKRWVSLLLSVLFSVLLLTSCSGHAGEETPPVNMDEFMKISAFVLNKELEGKGHWNYIAKGNINNGSWVPNEGEAEVALEDVFIKEALEVGEVRVMAPMGYTPKGYNLPNLNLFFDFDGILEIETAEEDGKTIRLACSLDGSSPTEGNGLRVNAPATINICPIGKETYFEGTENLIKSDTIVGKEYTLYARAYGMDGKLMVSAELKLVTLEDEYYPYEEVIKSKWGYSEMTSVGDALTRFVSVELVSYEYSDMYKLLY